MWRKAGTAKIDAQFFHSEAFIWNIDSSRWRMRPMSFGGCIDVMHNVWLGVAKAVMKLLTRGQDAYELEVTTPKLDDKTGETTLDANGHIVNEARKIVEGVEKKKMETMSACQPVISKGDLAVLQAYMTSMHPPKDIGRILQRL